MTRSEAVEAIHGECLLMFAGPTGVHRFHHWLGACWDGCPLEPDAHLLP